LNVRFVQGGYDGSQFCSLVEIYDPKANQWRAGMSLTHERSGHGSALTIEPTLNDDNDD
jgi:hypothetical protein